MRTSVGMKDSEPTMFDKIREKTKAVINISLSKLDF